MTEEARRGDLTLRRRPLCGAWAAAPQGTCSEAVALSRFSPRGQLRAGAEDGRGAEWPGRPSLCGLGPGGAACVEWARGVSGPPPHDARSPGGTQRPRAQRVGFHTLKLLPQLKKKKKKRKKKGDFFCKVQQFSTEVQPSVSPTQ